ncbi:radical SAM domain-containing protein [Marine Group I thaumarchaeote SCGC AAA799-P11]|uniref:Radical SAM domain-containing protein n=1 Tax=Marine Group I thaumarchaeote SCGC AAA799-P11 TaxID=1502295 RepID=A0A087S2X3_9ARCH|nr:radical SAM domain-containing protein [Marine Group I thaumarchaeote SCGC AAA799-P11]
MNNSVDITTNIGCRVQCKFCPQDVSMSNYASKNNFKKIEFGKPILMSYQTFVTILKKIPKNVLIRFSGFSEPFLNPECIKMIKHASDNGYQIQLYSTLVGMTINDIDILTTIKLQKFVIHLADNEKYAKIPLALHKEILKKIVASHIENIFFMTMGTLPDEIKKIIGMDVKASEMVDWAGNIDFGRKTDRITGPILCTMNRSKNNRDIPPIILPNGDTVLCCKDWKMDYVLGNLCNCEYDELFRSKTYHEVLKKMRSENDDILCRNCEFALSINKEKNLKQQYADLGINPSDEIGTKLDELYQYYLMRPIDPEGLIFFYIKIKNNDLTYDDIEKQILQSSEYASIPKKIISNN